MESKINHLPTEAKSTARVRPASNACRASEQQSSCLSQCTKGSGVKKVRKVIVRMVKQRKDHHSKAGHQIAPSEAAEKDSEKQEEKEDGESIDDVYATTSAILVWFHCMPTQ